MSPTAIVILIVAAVVIIALLMMYTRRQRSAGLKQKFGPEYDRLVQEHGNPNKAERILEQRQKRVEHLRIHPLEAPQRDAFAEQWRREQALFVDDPGTAVQNADRLVGEVMAARGYPVGDFEQRAADVSVDHPNVVREYRLAHDLAVRHASGKASTEDMRQAMVHYRNLFEDLLEVPVQRTVTREEVRA